MTDGMLRLPEWLTGTDGLVLRRWRLEDAGQLQRVVRDSADHLRPWMRWMASEPLTLADRQAMLQQGEQEWLSGGDVMLGVFLDGRAVGGCGLHRRIAPGGLEIGYWIDPRFTRRGLATSSAGLLTGAAFEVPSISHVEIHHDKANVASAGIPQRLGYRLVGEAPDTAEAPAEIGIECVWRTDRGGWNQHLAGRRSSSTSSPSSRASLRAIREARGRGPREAR